MSLEIVMYHYVRPIKNSDFPTIKGLEVDAFIRQIEFFKKYKTVLTTSEVIEYFYKKTKIPNNSIWLTFDDGYKDHIKYVSPILENFGFDAIFFPVSDTFTKNKILDVNAIQFIIAKSNNENNLLDILKNAILNEGYSENDFKKFWDNTDKARRFDSENIAFFKNMLQKKMKDEERKRIIKKLFEDIVKKKEEDFSKELYMSKSDIKLLLKKGFSVGSHTASHKWLNQLNFKEQETQITESIKELRKLNNDMEDFIVCYPYGAYNNNTLKILKENSCSLALTTKVGKVNSHMYSKFELPRFDTNDFPQ